MHRCPAPSSATPSGFPQPNVRRPIGITLGLAAPPSIVGARQQPAPMLDTGDRLADR
jgi:hypothetical protein